MYWISISGAGIYVHAGHKVLPNNSIIVAGADNRIGDFRCVSGSRRNDVGHFFDTGGMEATFSHSDSFLVTRGSSHSPGMLHVRSFSALQPRDQGVYTCRIPDENEKLVSVNVGLYLRDFISKFLIQVLGSTLFAIFSCMHFDVPVESPVIESLEADLEGQRLICTTSQSPATNIIWTFNDITIAYNSSQHKLSQILLDRRNSLYKNVLTVEGSFEETVGEYSCTVENSAGNDTTGTTIKGEL